jgi:hypothetical protein
MTRPAFPGHWGDGSRTGIAWFAVKPNFSAGAVSGRVVCQGYVAVAGESVIFPSLAFAGYSGGTVGRWGARCRPNLRRIRCKSVDAATARRRWHVQY